MGRSRTNPYWREGAGRRADFISIRNPKFSNYVIFNMMSVGRFLKHLDDPVMSENSTDCYAAARS